MFGRGLIRKSEVQSLIVIKGQRATIPKNRKPTHPGEILLEEFLTSAGMSQVELARNMGIPIQRINTMINGKGDMTAETAVLLSRVLKTSSEFWMKLQIACDLYEADRTLEDAA